MKSFEDRKAELLHVLSYSERMPTKLKALDVRCLSEGQFNKYRFATTYRGVPVHVVAAGRGSVSVRSSSGVQHLVVDAHLEFTVTLDPNYLKTGLANWTDVPRNMSNEDYAVHLAMEETTDEEMKDLDYLAERIATWEDLIEADKQAEQ